MRKLQVFESITLDGYFSGPDGDLSWAHSGTPDPEFQRFVEGNAASPGDILLGRVTYELMASYWPTPMAAQNDPIVAKGMNEAEKLVISRTLKKTDWANTRVIDGELLDAVRALKRQEGKDLVILGSGSVVRQLAGAGLVDQFQFVVKPVALGKGRTVFEGLEAPLALTLTESRAFRDGSVMLNYARPS